MQVLVVLKDIFEVKNHFEIPVARIKNHNKYVDNAINELLKLKNFRNHYFRFNVKGVPLYDFHKVGMLVT